MKCSEEWVGHARDLRRIVSALKRRPTLEASDQIETLSNMANSLDKAAQEYAAEFETQ